MGWLGLKKRPGHDKDEEDSLEQEPKQLQPLTPVLNLLVPDIAGVTSFHLRQFFDAAEAEEYVQSLPSISGLHAFWGLSEPPPGHQEGEGTGEAMVLIRSAENSDTVYVVSFVDLESALSFARFEVKRGMSLGLLLIYWAEIVEVDIDERGVRLSPDAPPLPGYQSHRSWTEAGNEPPAGTAPVAEVGTPAPDSAPAVEPQVVAEEPVPAVEEPAPVVMEVPEEEQPQATETELGWEAETSEAFEKETEEQFEQFVAEQEDLRAAEQPAVELAVEPPAEVEEPAPVAEPVAAEEPEPVATEAEPAAEPQTDTRTQEEMDIEREAIAFLKASTKGKKSATLPDETTARETIEISINARAPREPEPLPEPQEVVEPVEVIDPEPEPEPAPEPAIPVKVEVGAVAHQEHESQEESTEDLVEEVEKILKVKRWDKRESPFKGFDSPPGRF